MTTTTSPLDAARDDLRNRLFAAQEAEHWELAAILVPLYDVADMVCRIGDHTSSTHYQVSKASPMVHAAIRTRAAAFDRSSSHLADDAFEMSSVLCELDAALSSCLWAKSRTAAGVYESDARELRSAVAKLSRFVDQVTANPEPDPVD